MNVGIDRLIEDLAELGYTATIVKDVNNHNYALISNFDILDGHFKNRVVRLAIPAPPDYPRTVGAAIHVSADPQLVPKGNTPTRNVTDSALGGEWQYWSYKFQSRPKSPTQELMIQIHAIFRTIQP